MNFLRNKYNENKEDVDDIISKIIIGKDGKSAFDNYTLNIVEDNEIDSIKDLFNSSNEFLEKVSSIFEKINLPWTLRFIYYSLGSLNRQFYYKNFVWLSINEIEKRLDILEKIGQIHIADIAIKYIGLQKYQILTILKENGKFFIRNDGGNSNEKRNNWKFTIEFNPSIYDDSYFSNLTNILNNENDSIYYENIN